MSRRRICWIMLVALVALVALVGSLAGWVSPPRPWQQSTGWDQIPIADRGAIVSRLWPGEAAPKIRWLGHAGFVLDWHGVRLAIDPNTSAWCTLARRTMMRPERLASLGALDAVLISHAHYDHLDLATLADARLGTIVMPAGSEGYVSSLVGAGATVRGLAERESLRVGGLEIIAVPAVHHGNRLHPLASRRRALGYVIRPAAPSGSATGSAILVAGDTGFGDHFAAIRDAYRPRIALLPIGAYAPSFPIERVHLNPEQAVRAAQILEVEAMMPMHFGTFPLSLDRPDDALPRFARAAREAGLRWLMPSFLGPGDLEASAHPEGFLLGRASR